jgi:hypothetical protein
MLVCLTQDKVEYFSNCFSENFRSSESSEENVSTNLNRHNWRRNSGHYPHAIALSEHNPNIHLTIFESRLRFSEISAGVGFGPNAIKAMDLISPKITEAYNKVKTTNLWPEKANVWFDIRYGDGPKAGDLISEMTSMQLLRACYFLIRANSGV